MLIDQPVNTTFMSPNASAARRRNLIAIQYFDFKKTVFFDYSPESDGLISIKLSPPDFPVIRSILACSQVVLKHPKISPGRRFLSGHRGSVRPRSVSRLMDQPAWQPRVICPPSPTKGRLLHHFNMPHRELWVGRGSTSPTSS